MTTQALDQSLRAQLEETASSACRALDDTTRLTNEALACQQAPRPRRRAKAVGR